MRRKNDDESSLSHTRWNCQYHIVFTPKYRRKAIYRKLRRDIGVYLRRLCDYKGVEIAEAQALGENISILLEKYAEELSNRKIYRQKINELEQLLEAL